MDFAIEPRREALAEGLRHIAEEYDEDGRDYEMALSDFANAYIHAADPVKFTAAVQSIVDDAGVEEDVRFAALVLLNTYLRHRGKARRAYEIDEMERTTFGDRPTFMRCFLICERELGIPDDPGHVIRQARDLMERQPDSAGTQHLFADLVCTIAEQRLHPVGTELLQEALDTCDRAIHAQYDYAKFHATRARLLKLMGRWDDALDEIESAMNLEDPDSGSYTLRMSEYQRIQSQVLYEKVNSQLEQASANQMAELSRQSAHSVELVGFFASIVALVVSGVTIAAKLKFPSAVCLLLVLGGVLITSYGALTLALNASEAEGGAKGTRMTIVGIGLLLTVGGVIVGLLA